MLSRHNTASHPCTSQHTNLQHELNVLTGFGIFDAFLDDMVAILIPNARHHLPT